MTEAEWVSCTDPLLMLEYLRGPMSASPTKVIFGKAVTGFFGKRITERKSRLFACACCRRFWHLLDEEHCRHLVEYGRSFGSIDERGLTEPSLDACHRAVELAEWSADETVSPQELDGLSDAASVLYHPASDYCSCYDETVGPFDCEFVASGEAAQAVAYATSMKPNVVLGGWMEAFDSLHLVIDWTTKAAGCLRKTRDASTSERGASEERLLQCALFREVVGNPFRPVAMHSAWMTPVVIELARAIYDGRDFDRMPILADALEEAGCTVKEVLEHCRNGQEHARGCWAVDKVLGKD
jgi:hypothetical protein